MSQKSLVGLFFLAALSLLHAQVAVPPNPGIVSAPPGGPQDGQKVMFYGDTTMQDGFNARGGFVHLIDQAFQQQNRQLVILHPLTPGYLRDLLASFQKVVLAQQPDWLLIGCGFYDSNSNITPAQFKTNLGSLLDQAAGLKVVLFTPIMNGEDPNTPPNQKMAPYCDAIRALAQERNLPLADVNAVMQTSIPQIRAQVDLPNPGLLLTNDAAHLNGFGHEIVAAEILRVFGFSSSQIARARDVWLDIPDGMDLVPRGTVSVRQYLQLRNLAAGEGLTVNQLLYDMLQKDVMHLLVNGAPPRKKKHE